MIALFKNKIVTIILGLLLIAVIGVVDYFTGYELNFFVFYFIPVSLVAWRNGRFWGITMSFVSAIVWGFVDYSSGHTYSHPAYYFWNTAIRLISYLFLAVSVNMVHVLLVRQSKLYDDLTHAIADVKQLRGYLPICASCKKIRNDGGYWEQIEKYISEHSQAEFTHGICPECAKRLYPGLWKEKNREDTRKV